MLTPYKGISLSQQEKLEMLELLDFLQMDIIDGNPFTSDTEFKPSISVIELAQLPKSFFNYFEITQI